MNTRIKIYSILLIMNIIMNWSIQLMISLLKLMRMGIASIKKGSIVIIRKTMIKIIKIMNLLFGNMKKEMKLRNNAERCMIILKCYIIVWRINIMANQGWSCILRRNQTIWRILGMLRILLILAMPLPKVQHNRQLKSIWTKIIYSKWKIN